MIREYRLWSLECDMCGMRSLQGMYEDYSEAERRLSGRARQNRWQLEVDGYERDVCSLCQRKEQ